MHIVRRAHAREWGEIKEIIRDLDLDHPRLSCENFWVAEADRRIAGIAHLEMCGEGLYLSSVGVSKEKRGLGIARSLMEKILEDTEGRVFVYTIIPDFFRRFGFVEARPPPGIPPREIYNCRSTCDANRCVCMVKAK